MTMHLKDESSFHGIELLPFEAIAVVPEPGRTMIIPIDGPGLDFYATWLKGHKGCRDLDLRVQREIGLGATRDRLPLLIDAPESDIKKSIANVYSNSSGNNVNVVAFEAGKYRLDALDATLAKSF